MGPVRKRASPSDGTASRGEHRLEGPNPGDWPCLADRLGERIFLVSCREDRQDRVLLSLDRSSGRMLWERTVVHAPLEPSTDSTAMPRAPRPRTAVGLRELPGPPVDARGGLRFRRRSSLAGPARRIPQQAWLLQLRRAVREPGDRQRRPRWRFVSGGPRSRDGRTVWKTPRENKTRSYCPPIIREIDGRTQMILSGDKCVASYDPRNGSRHGSSTGQPNSSLLRWSTTANFYS